MKKSILSLFFCLALLLGQGLTPVDTFAATDVKAMSDDMSLIKGTTNNGVEFVPGSYIYFGNFSYVGSAEPVKWRVLDNEKDNTGDPGIFLLAEERLALQKFEATYTDDGDGQTKPNEWQNSDAQGWCQDFYDSAFTSAEQKMVKAVSKEDEAMKVFTLDWGKSSLQDEEVFFLSAEEVRDYVGEYQHPDAAVSNAWWWMRSPSATNPRKAGLVTEKVINLAQGGITEEGRVSFDFDTVYEGPVRPAFNLKDEGILFLSAAENGKVSNSTGAGALMPIASYSGNEWKLTLLDSNRSFDAAEKMIVSTTGSTVTINYENAVVGQNECVSVIIADEGDFLYYGIIKEVLNADDSAQLTIPGNLTPGAYTMKVFNENYNGDKQTDLASAFVDIALYVAVIPVDTDDDGKADQNVPATDNDGDGIYTDGGNNTYIPVDVDGDGTTDVYVKAADGGAAPDVTGGDGTFTDEKGNTYKGVDSDNDGITDYFEKEAALTISVNPNSVKGGGTVTLTTNKNVSGITCDDSTIVITGSGCTWTAVLPAASKTYTFTAAVGAKSSSVSVSVYNGGGSSGGGSGSGSINYTLTFDTNGGSSIKSISDVSGKVISLGKYVPVKEGYTFEGWYTNKNLTGAVSEVKLNGNMTVYAKWSEKEAKAPVFPFKDVTPTDWSYKDVYYVWEKGLMNGTSAELFDSQFNTSRAMIATIIWRMEGEPKVNYNMSFGDVSDGMWYTEAIRWAQSKAVVKGYSAEEFGPEDLVTREQMAAMLYRYTAFKGYDVSARANLSGFSDYRNVGWWAVDNVAWANAKGLIKGVTADKLEPQGLATREQVAAILHRYCENVIK